MLTTSPPSSIGRPLVSTHFSFWECEGFGKKHGIHQKIDPIRSQTIKPELLCWCRTSENHVRHHPAALHNQLHRPIGFRWPELRPRLHGHRTRFISPFRLPDAAHAHQPIFPIHFLGETIMRPPVFLCNHGCLRQNLRVRSICCFMQVWHPSHGYVNNWDGARGEYFRDYKQA